MALNLTVGGRGERLTKGRLSDEHLETAGCLGVNADHHDSILHCMIMGWEGGVDCRLRNDSKQTLAVDDAELTGKLGLFIS